MPLPSCEEILSTLRQAPGNALSFRKLTAIFPNCDDDLLKRVTVMEQSRDGIRFNEPWKDSSDLVIRLVQ
jgi:hypothetical protein